MKTCIRRVAMLSVLLMWGAPAFAQTPMGTGFTYQGHLTDGGFPVTGVCDFEFRLFDAAAGGAQVGTTVSLTGVPIAGGRFSVPLDFGADAFGESARWLEVRVYRATAGWTALSPRQRVTPTPQAFYAGAAGAIVLPYETSVTTDGVGFGVYSSGGEGGVALAAGHTGAECTAISATSEGADGVGVSAHAAGANGAAVYGVATNTGGCGLRGYAGPNAAYGGDFSAGGTTSAALRGVAGGASGRGVYGRAAAASGINYGVYGETASMHGYGGYFVGRGYFSGNLGLGVANPVQKLEVAGTIVSTGLKLTTGAAAGHVLTSDADGVGTWQPPGAGSSLWAATGDDIYYDTGYVGVGTTVPAARLDILGGAWDLVVTEGDLRIGNSDHRLKVGVATSGGGAGLARLRAQSDTGTPKVVLGAGANDTLTVTSTNVGVGTLNPASDAKLDVSGKLKTTSFQLPTGAVDGYVLRCDASGLASWQEVSEGQLTLPYDDSISSGFAGIKITNTGSGAGLYGVGDYFGIRGESSGIAVYGFSAGGKAVYGNTTSGVAVHANSGGSGLASPALFASNTHAAGVAIYSTNASSDANIVAANAGSGDLIKGFSGAGGGDLVFRVANDGWTTVSVLEITGGADLAEPFDVSGAAVLEPGTVVCIDPEHAGHLTISRTAYDRTVAGVISGAGGVQTGMLMGQRKSVADGQHAVALTGRVYVRADATDHAIEPGDLLTTSASPGRAMKVTDHERAQGAVIGKAMTRLAQGETGLVLVLVSLQ